MCVWAQCVDAGLWICACGVWVCAAHTCRNAHGYCAHMCGVWVCVACVRVLCVQRMCVCVQCVCMQCCTCMCVVCGGGVGVITWSHSRMTERTGSHPCCLENRAEPSLLCAHRWPWLPSEHGPEASGHHRRPSGFRSRLCSHLPTLPSYHLFW